MAQAQRSRMVLDLESFLEVVKRRLDLGALTFAEAAHKAADKQELTPWLEAEARSRGLAEIAREHLGTAPRGAIMRSIKGIRTETPGRTVHVEVTRSALRDWPVVTVSGYRRLEDCSIEEAEGQVEHFARTIAGIERRRAVIAAVVGKAKAAGVARIGNLTDEVLEECLSLMGGDE